MKKYSLVMRKVDKKFFAAIKQGKKSVETRAATIRFQKIKEGDVLKFVCDGQVLEKKVLKVSHFKTIDDLVEQIEFKKIMPFVSSVGEMKQTYNNFSGYKEKIKKFGLVAFNLG